MRNTETAAAGRSLQARDGVLHAGTRRVTALDRETLAVQKRLAEIPAPTGLEQQRGLAVSDAFRAAGCPQVRTDAVGNVIATLGDAISQADVAPVVCLAHLDTVFDAAAPLSVTQQGTRLSCPGIGDNSRGLAAMLTLARVLQEHQFSVGHLPRPLEFVATVGEEGLGNLRGARAYFADRSAEGHPAPRAVLVLDGPGDDTIVHHALGSRRYRVTFRGAGGHSWANFGAPNAVHAASRAAAWLADLPHSLKARVAVTVSSIGGGESMNAIPAHAWIEIDVRAHDDALLMRVDAELRAIVHAAAHAETAAITENRHRFRQEIAQFRHDIALLGERPSGALPLEHELVQLAQRVSRRHGIEPVSAIASTDANVPLSLGIPAITIGGGGTGGSAHTLHEWYDNTNGPRGVSRAFSILAALAL